jgi:DNA repair protein RAD5
MDGVDLEQRPAKKRRFFVEDSPVHDSSLSGEPSLPDEVNALPETGRRDERATDFASSDGFDVTLLCSFVGEQLPEETLSKLRELSDGDVQRGRSASPQGTVLLLIYCSN